MIRYPSDWGARNFQTLPGQYFVFSSGPAEQPSSLMSSVAVSSGDSPVVRWNAEGSGWVHPEQDLIRILVEYFKDVPQVHSICAHFDTQSVTIWTILGAYDSEARSRVHQKELEVGQTFSVYDIDFRVTSSDLVSPAELTANGWWEIYRQR